ncbi:hypothetical protein BU055_13260, partial [Staphylococcus succinus]
MDFSIIIPFKDKGNNERFLENCIESLNNQTYQDFEVLFLHNKSERLQTLTQHTQLNIRTLEMSETDQLTDYRNLGLEQAKGEFLIFMDADDYLHPNALIYAKQMIESSKDNTDVFKFAITKTNLDKTSTLKKNKRVFFDGEAFSKLEAVMNGANISVDDVQLKQIINGFFENQMINHKSEHVKPVNYLSRLNYQFRVHSFIIRKSFLIDNQLNFKSKNTLYSDIPFLIELYNNTSNIKQTSTKLYYK